MPEGDQNFEKSPQSTRGHSSKYVELISELEPGTAYTPATIAWFAEDRGFLEIDETSSIEDIRLAKQRVRINMGRLSQKSCFPEMGDELVKIPGQSPTPGWLGSRWQAAIRK